MLDRAAEYLVYAWHSAVLPTRQHCVRSPCIAKAMALGGNLVAPGGVFGGAITSAGRGSVAGVGGGDGLPLPAQQGVAGHYQGPCLG